MGGTVRALLRGHLLGLDPGEHAAPLFEGVGVGEIVAEEVCTEIAFGGVGVVAIGAVFLDERFREFGGVEGCDEGEREEDGEVAHHGVVRGVDGGMD